MFTTKVLHHHTRLCMVCCTTAWLLCQSSVRTFMMVLWRSVTGAQGEIRCQLLQSACCTCKKVLLTTTSWHIVGQSVCLELGATHIQLMSLTTCKTILSYTYETLYQVTHTGCTSSTAVSTSQQCRVSRYHNTTHNGICAVDKQKKLMLNENAHST